MNVVAIRGLTSKSYVAPVRAAPQEREADEALRPQDVDDLRWMWGSLDAAAGIRSTFGAQLERCATAQPTEDAVLDARKHQRGRVRDWVALGHGASDPGSPKWDVETMPVHETPPFACADPYEDDSILQTIARSRRIRSALLRCQRGSVLVLHAVYGPALGDEELV